MFVLLLITAVTVLLTGCGQVNTDTLSDKNTMQKEITGSDSVEQTVEEETEKMLQLISRSASEIMQQRAAHHTDVHVRRF